MADHIPTAEEATELTHKQIVQKSGVLFDKVVDAINKAAQSLLNEAEVHLQGTEARMAQHLMDTLTKVGYKVSSAENNDPRDGTWITVRFSWPKEKKK